MSITRIPLEVKQESQNEYFLHKIQKPKTCHYCFKRTNSKWTTTILENKIFLIITICPECVRYEEGCQRNQDKMQKEFLLIERNKTRLKQKEKEKKARIDWMNEDYKNFLLQQKENKKKATKSYLKLQILKRKVRKRDFDKCFLCSSSENLEVHHITPVRLNPLKAEDINNMITLCFNCHREKAHVNNTKDLDYDLMTKFANYTHAKN